MDSITEMDYEADGHGERLAEALDRCVSQVRAGEALDGVLAEYPDLAAELAPLLAQAAALAAGRSSPAAPTAGLAVGRARLLEAAARARAASPVASATAAAAVDDPQVVEALDASLAQVRAGMDAERAVAAFPRLLPALAPLLATAGAVVAGRVTPPPAPRGLRPARARFLAAAAELRAAGATAPADWTSRLVAWLGLGAGAAPARRLATAALGAALMLVLSTGAMSVASADALPGDPLYGVKQLGERVRLVLAISPAARAVVEADVSQERADELSRLADAGRTAELTWDARLIGVADADGTGAARLLVAPLGAVDDAHPVALAWSDVTRADLGALPVVDGPLAALRQLPPGLRLRLVVATGGVGLARLLYVQLLEPPQAAQAPPLAPVGPATAAPETATPAPSATTAATATLPATATTAAPATATAPATPTLPPTSAPVEEPTATEPEDVLNGVLAQKLSDGLWQVGDFGQAGREVEVDVADVGADRRDAVRIGYVVKLVGHWVGRDGSRFRASDLIQWRPPTCTADHVTNRRIVTLVAGEWLTLEGEAGEFRFTPETVVTGMLTEGMAVDMAFRRCDNGRQEIETIGPAAGQTDETFQGTIRDLDAPAGTFTLEELDTGELFTVRLAPGAAVVGGSGQLRVGQVVDVTGRRDGAEPQLILATRVVIRREPQGAPAMPTSAAPGPGEAPPATVAPPGEPTELPGGRAA